MELIYSLPTNLGMVANALKFLLESVSLFCVALGLVTGPWPAGLPATSRQI